MPEDGDEQEDGQEGEEGEGDDDYIDEEEMLDVAERCFQLISQEVLKSKVTITEAFGPFIEERDIGEGESV